MVEVLVAAGILGLMMTAVLSFYIEAIAVTAKRDEHSQRLRRFHLGLDKIEQWLREGQVIDLTNRTVTFLMLEEQKELYGFPNYKEAPAQLVSSEDGVIFLHDGRRETVLPTKAGENVIFRWIQENPPDPPEKLVLNVALYYSGAEDGRSDLLFHRTINPQRY